MFENFRTWAGNLSSLTENKAKHAADLAEAKAEAKAELVAKDIEHAKIVAKLRNDFEAAVADLKRELAIVKSQFDAEATYVRAAVNFLRMSKRTVPNVIGSAPVPPPRA